MLSYIVGVRVRLNQVDTLAYEQCLRALLETVKEDHPTFAVGKTLLGIITDWSDQQYNGLVEVVSEDVAQNVVKGCQVGRMLSADLPNDQSCNSSHNYPGALYGICQKSCTESEQREKTRSSSLYSNWIHAIRSHRY